MIVMVRLGSGLALQGWGTSDIGPVGLIPLVIVVNAS